MDEQVRSHELSVSGETSWGDASNAIIEIERDQD
jgi:hypothetical protein